MNEPKRNEPCPCGSGKKYKKCCGFNKVVNFPNRLEEDFQNLLSEFTEFIIEEDLVESVINMEDNLAEWVLQGNRAFYQVLFEQQSNGSLLFDLFLRKQQKKGARSTTLEAMKELKNAIPSMFMYIERLSPEQVLFKDLLTEETHHVNNPAGGFTLHDPEQMPYLLEIIGQWGPEYRFLQIPFPADQVLFDLTTQAIEEEKGKQDLSSFYRRHFLTVLRVTSEKIGQLYSLQIMITEEEAEVIHLLEQKGSKTFLQEEMYDDLLDFWYAFCSYYMTDIRKPAVFSAALEYFFYDSDYFDTVSNERVTQKEIASRYSVSTSSLSKQVEDLYEAIVEMIQAEIDDRSVNTPQIVSGPPSIAGERAMFEVVSRLNENNLDDFQKAASVSGDAPPFKPKNEKEAVQMMVYEAIKEENPKKQARLIESIMGLDPQNIDGLILSSNLAENSVEAENYLLKAMVQGKNKLKDILADENPPEILWRLLEARPSMRALGSLASFYQEKDDHPQAIPYMEGLLEMNPSDNQGIRYQLLESYRSVGDKKKASALRKTYPEL